MKLPVNRNGKCSATNVGCPRNQAQRLGFWKKSPTRREMSTDHLLLISVRVVAHSPESVWSSSTHDQRRVFSYFDNTKLFSSLLLNYTFTFLTELRDPAFFDSLLTDTGSPPSEPCFSFIFDPPYSSPPPSFWSLPNSAFSR